MENYAVERRAAGEDADDAPLMNVGPSKIASDRGGGLS